MCVSVCVRGLRSNQGPTYLEAAEASDLKSWKWGAVTYKECRARMITNAYGICSNTCLHLSENEDLRTAPIISDTPKVQAPEAQAAAVELWVAESFLLFLQSTGKMKHSANAMNSIGV